MATKTNPSRGTKAAQDKAAREAKAAAADEAKMQSEMDAQAEARADAKQAEQAEVDGANTTAEVEASEKRAPRPTTELGAPEKVDSLPEISRGTTSNGQRQRSQRWVKQLAPVIADPGSWYKVAEFNASSTAGTQSSALRVAARTMSEGGEPKIMLPEFDTAKFELVVLKRGLAIYARLVERTAEQADDESAEGETPEQEQAPASA